MNAPRMTLEMGDRVPNFVLPNHEGSGLMFYNKTKGGPIILLVYAGNGDPATRREIDAFVNLRSRLADLGAEVFVINRDNPRNNAALATALGGGAHVLCDPARKITTAFAEAVNAGWTDAGDGSCPAFSLVLDPNQRVLEVLHADRRTLAERALETLRRELPDTETLELSTTAPVLILPNMLDPGLCRRLIETWETEGHAEGDVFAVRDGQSTRDVDYGQKKRLDHAIRDESLTKLLLGKIGPRLADEVFKAYSFADFVLERFIIGVYDDQRGDYFRAHRDNIGPATASRRFAMSIHLNDGYEGGGVTFPEYGPHIFKTPAGGAIIFSCALIHAALPVTSGRRFVLLTCLRDAQNRPHPWSLGAGG